MSFRYEHKEHMFNVNRLLVSKKMFATSLKPSVVLLQMITELHSNGRKLMDLSFQSISEKTSTKRNSYSTLAPTTARGRG